MANIDRSSRSHALIRTTETDWVLQDVDLTEQIITVRDTKFFKTCLVAIGPKLNQELAARIERRRLLPLPRGGNAVVHHARWSAVACVRAISWFQHVRRAAGIGRPVGEPRPPRLHDIRHTAAV